MECEILSQINTCGYSELENKEIGKNLFEEIYKQFSAVAKEMENDNRQMIDFFKNSSRYFDNSKFKKIFNGCRKGHGKESSVNHNYAYIQFSSEYFELVENNLKQELQKSDLLTNLFNNLLFVDKVVKSMANKVIDTIDKSAPGFKDRMYGGRDSLTVISKVWEYNNIGKMAAPPHYDRSGLTILLDNTDKGGESLLMSPYRDPFDFSLLKMPCRKFSGNKNTTSALLIPGILIKDQGFPFNPTPHAVAKFKDSNRYSMVALILIPNLDLTNVNNIIGYYE